jgi:hypothetical protein
VIVDLINLTREESNFSGIQETSFAEERFFLRVSAFLIKNSRIGNQDFRL